MLLRRSGDWQQLGQQRRPLGGPLGFTIAVLTVSRDFYVLRQIMWRPRLWLAPTL